MKIVYPIVRAFFYLLSLLPFGVLFLLSDGLYLLAYHLVRYRRKVVRDNLVSSFPEKSGPEIKQIEKGFYHFLCDYFFETLKLLSMSPEQMLRHIEFRGLEQVEKCFDEGQTCAGILGHYCNWEYNSTTAIALQRHHEAAIGLIYHPLYNQVMDRLFIDLRQHFGGVCVPKKDILRYLLTYKREGRMSLFGYISDQAPKWENIHLWLPFLNHDTPVFTGGEKIMRKMNNAVFYVDMERPRRGHYVVTYHLITRNPSEMEPNGITRRFFEMLEASIRRDPRFYLWSHKRWKRTHEEFDRRFEVVNGHVVPRKTNTNEQ